MRSRPPRRKSSASSQARQQPAHACRPREENAAHLAHLGKHKLIVLLLSLATERPLRIGRVLHLANDDVEQLREEGLLDVRHREAALLLLLVQPEDGGGKGGDGDSVEEVVRVGEKLEEEGEERRRHRLGRELRFCRSRGLELFS